MSLTVSSELAERARQGEIDDPAFLECVRTSLPYAWQLVTSLVGELRAGDADLADNQVPPPGETERGQLLRMLASDAMRGAVERHFGIRLAFQNCHRVAVFRPDADEAYRTFVTPRAQLLNQTPELVDC